MGLKFKGGGIVKVRGASLKDYPSAAVTHDYVTVQSAGGTTVATTIDDANFNDYTGATYHREGSISLIGTGVTEIINLDPTVGTVGSDGLLTRLSSGVMRLLVKFGKLTIPLSVDMRDKTDELDQPNAYASTVVGSLAEHLQYYVDSRIDNTMTMNANGKVFTTQDHATPNYVRNASVWCNDIDLTCMSPWNNNGGATKAGTLITPRHMINAAHYELSVGNTVRFVASDNTVHNRTITGKVRHPNYRPYSPDMTIYTLDSDLPASITPCKVMPSNWSNYLVQNFHNRPPALGLDQEEKALIIDFNGGGSFLRSIDADRLIFHENKISGDSGNPSFLIVNGELVLITVWTYGGAGSGTPVSSYLTDINAMIVTSDAQSGANTGYTVTEADFSAFPNYA